MYEIQSHQEDHSQCPRRSYIFQVAMFVFLANLMSVSVNNRNSVPTCPRTAVIYHVPYPSLFETHHVPPYMAGSLPRPRCGLLRSPRLAPG
jgi:hypothetical protein